MFSCEENNNFKTLKPISFVNNTKNQFDNQPSAKIVFFLKRNIFCDIMATLRVC